MAHKMHPALATVLDADLDRLASPHMVALFRAMDARAAFICDMNNMGPKHPATQTAAVAVAEAMQGLIDVCNLDPI
jgi:hypothetical protein